MRRVENERALYIFQVWKRNITSTAVVLAGVGVVADTAVDMDMEVMDLGEVTHHSASTFTDPSNIHHMDIRNSAVDMVADMDMAEVVDTAEAATAVAAAGDGKAKVGAGK